MENLSRALESLPQEREALDATVKNLVVGLEMVSRELETVLTRHGITRIMPLGANLTQANTKLCLKCRPMKPKPDTLCKWRNRLDVA